MSDYQQPPAGPKGQPPQPQPGGYPAQQPGHPPPPGQPQYGAPDAPYGVDPKTGIPFSDKQKIIAFLLQFMLGGFGAGRFYTGHTGIAVAQIAVTWLTLGLGGIWPFIDSIMMLLGNVTDSEGRPLRD